MSENKEPYVMVVDKLREKLCAFLRMKQCFDEAMNCVAAEAYLAGSCGPVDSDTPGYGYYDEFVPAKFYSTCRQAFAEKLSRTNDMDAAFVKMVWVAYQMGAKQS